MKCFLLFFIMSFSLQAAICSNEKAISRFFDHLENNHQLDNYENITLYGKDSKSDKILELVFQKSSPFSTNPGIFSEGTFSIKAGGRLSLPIEIGDLAQGYQTYGKLRASYFKKYLEWRPESGGVSVKFFYESDGALSKVIYKNNSNSISYEFKPTQNEAIQTAFYSE